MNKRITLIVAAIAGVVVIGAATAAYYTAGTPQYSLYLLKKSLEQKDKQTFFELFDTEQVIANAVERAVGGVPAGPKVVSKKATDVLIPAASSVLKEKIQERLDSPEPITLAGMNISGVRYQGNVAFVTLKSPDDNSETILSMERMKSRRWKIVDLDLSKAGVSFSLDDARRRAEESGTPGALQVPQSGELPAFPGPRRR